MQRGQVGADFFPARAREQRDPGLGGVEVVGGGVGFAGGGGQRRFGEWVADELRVDAAVAVEGLFEWEDDEHARDALLHPAQARALPRPELRRNEPDDGHARCVQMPGEAEVDVGEVDEDGDVGEVLLYAADKAAIAGVDAGDVEEDFGDAHDGYIFGADDLDLMFGGHLAPAEASEGGLRQVAAQLGDEGCAVVVSGGLAGGEEDARVGDWWRWFQV